MVDNIEEMVERMGKIDDAIALEEKEKEERKEGDGIIAATVRKKYTGAIAIVMIEGQQVRTLVDSGACETIMSYAWVVHLGLKKRINARNKGPKDLAAATGDGIDFVGSIQLDVKIGEKKVVWKAWVARRLVDLSL